MKARFWRIFGLESGWSQGKICSRQKTLKRLFEAFLKTDTEEGRPAESKTSQQADEV